MSVLNNTGIRMGASGASGAPWEYWEGMGDNWNSSGTTTSDSNDYINRALPSDGKVYWEVTLGTPAVYENIGLQTGASGLGSGYNNSTVGYYYNGNPPIFMSSGGGGAQVSHGSTTGVNWVAGKKLMFAWDSTGGDSNGLFYLGYDGTWYNSGDPEAGTGACFLLMDTTASWYMKTGYASGDGVPITNVASASQEFMP